MRSPGGDGRAPRTRARRPSAPAGRGLAPRVDGPPLLQLHRRSRRSSSSGWSFRDPWGNHVQVVGYRDIQFTKAPRGVARHGPRRAREERESARGAARERACRPVIFMVVVSARRWPLAKRLADLPVVAEGVLDPAQQPAVGLVRRVDLGGAGGNGPPRRRCGVLDDQEHAHRAAAERLRAEVSCGGDSSATQNECRRPPAGRRPRACRPSPPTRYTSTAPNTAL